MSAPRFFLVVLLLGGLASAGSSQASAAGRQYYSKHWVKNQGYYYKQFHYKPTVKAVTYRYHYVVHYPSKPRYYYYFNPYTKKYWGRYNRQEAGYSQLQPAEQREQVSEIAESAFPKPAGMPPIPEADDTVAIDTPPGDLPPDEGNNISAQKMVEITAKPGAEAKDLPRQAFSGWAKQGSYYHASYYSQPKKGGDYQAHRVIYYPAKPRYVYYYNPKTKKYWGRYNLEAQGYSLLAEKDKSDRLASIPESAFPTPSEMPPIPDSDDDVKMATPPKELPE